jgi:hypothetical membrane protein
MRAEPMATHRVPESTVRRTDRWLAAGGFIGPIVFVVVFTALGIARPGYSPIDQAVSDLGIGANDWILNASLIFMGLSLVGCAISLYRTVRFPASRALRSLGLVLLASVGLGFAVAGLFPETNPVHYVVGAPLAFAGSILGFLVTGVLLRRNVTWRTAGSLTLLASLATAILIVLTFYVFSFYRWSGGTAPVGQNGGLMERIVFVEIMAWFATVGWRLSRTNR